MNKKIELSIFVVIGIALATVLGTTFAYFAASKQGSGNNVAGSSFNFDASLSINTIYRANGLVPISNNLINTAISKQNNKCIDKNGHDVCSLYMITLSNGGNSIVLNPYVITSNTTYTTTNLKCQLYNSSYTAVSDVITLSNSNNGKVYLTYSGNNIDINSGSSNQVFYLAVWLTEVSSSQSNDYGKTFSGAFVLEASNGGNASVSFSS